MHHDEIKEFSSGLVSKRRTSCIDLLPANTSNNFMNSIAHQHFANQQRRGPAVVSRLQELGHLRRIGFCTEADLFVLGKHLLGPDAVVRKNVRSLGHLTSR